jgi:precorrin-3B C17-methyltransferase
VVGIGPGSPADRTRRAEEAIAASDAVVGYTRYLKLIEDLTGGKELVSTGMGNERKRCEAALRLASEGKTVSLVSSGDPGVYGMAGLAIEMANAQEFDVNIEIVPGISAANSAAARLGAPLMLDYACISLSDLLVPWETIKRRLEAVAEADMVVALYNPRSKKRVSQLEEAVETFGRHRPGTTPVGIVTDIGSEDESIVMTDLENLLAAEVNMRSVVLIGNKSSKLIGGWLVTPRGYDV